MRDLEGEKEKMRTKQKEEGSSARVLSDAVFVIATGARRCWCRYCGSVFSLVVGRFRQRAPDDVPLDLLQEGSQCDHHRAGIVFARPNVFRQVMVLSRELGQEPVQEERNVLRAQRRLARHQTEDRT